MSFEEVLRITTIDKKGTKIREDGFCIDESTGSIKIACVVPNFDTINIEEVKKALREHLPKKRVGVSFFSEKGNSNAFSTKTQNEALSIRMEPPYCDAEIELSNAVISKSYTYEQADNYMDIDSQLRLVSEFGKCQTGIILTAEKIVERLSWNINVAARNAMKKHGLPYLGALNGRIHYFNGSCVISKPIRDATALINCWQLSHFLKTGKTLYSRKKLIKMISP